MIQLTSFLLGIGVAWAFPAVSRVLRPVLVEAAVAGMALFDETRRAVAEQMETIEDIAAEARARHEDSLVTTTNGHHAGDAAAGDEEPRAEEPRAERARRRGDGPSRRRAG